MPRDTESLIFGANHLAYLYKVLSPIIADPEGNCRISLEATPEDLSTPAGLAIFFERLHQSAALALSKRDIDPERHVNADPDFTALIVRNIEKSALHWRAQQLLSDR